MNNNQNIENEKRVDELMAAITLYTTQLEDYDKSNFSSCMTCIGFVGGLIAAVGAILCTYSDNSKNILLKIPEYYAKFPVNKYGPFAMIIFLFILYFFSFWISLIFAHKSVSTNFITSYNWGSIILFGFCTFFDVLYVVSLMRNDIIIKSVKNACMNQNNMEEGV